MEAVARCVRKHAGLRLARRTENHMKKPSRRIQSERNGRAEAKTA